MLSIQTFLDTILKMLRQLSIGQMGRAQRDRRISNMMRTIVAVFVMCNTLPFIANLLELLLFALCTTQQQQLLLDSTMWIVLVESGNILVLLNAACTICVYVLYNDAYQRCIISICHC